MNLTNRTLMSIPCEEKEELRNKKVLHRKFWNKFPKFHINGAHFKKYGCCFPSVPNHFLKDWWMLLVSKCICIDLSYSIATQCKFEPLLNEKRVAFSWGFRHSDPFIVQMYYNKHLFWLPWFSTSSQHHNFMLKHEQFEPFQQFRLASTLLFFIWIDNFRNWHVASHRMCGLWNKHLFFFSSSTTIAASLSSNWMSLSSALLPEFHIRISSPQSHFSIFRIRISICPSVWWVLSVTRDATHLPKSLRNTLLNVNVCWLSSFIFSDVSGGLVAFLMLSVLPALGRFTLLLFEQMA